MVRPIHNTNTKLFGSPGSITIICCWYYSSRKLLLNKTFLTRSNNITCIIVLFTDGQILENDYSLEEHNDNDTRIDN